MKRILICGLPGSGKTTLAKKLVEVLGDADLYNADEVREKFNDWDFTAEGRERQMKRMQDYTRKSVAKNRYGVADFVCPTNVLQDEFKPDYTIFMNTIKEGRYEDTNKLFEHPDATNFGVTLTADEWWTEERIDMWARLIAVDIKDSQFQSKLPTTQIMVRDMPKTDDNPWDVLDICRNIELELAEFAGKFRTFPVPNIMNITYGRGVGYKIEEEVLDADIQEISGTKIRQELRDEGKI